MSLDINGPSLKSANRGLGSIEASHESSLENLKGDKPDMTAQVFNFYMQSQ